MGQAAGTLSVKKPRMTADDFRQLALDMPEALEREHMGHPDFRVDNRIFASLHHDDEFGMVTLTPEQQAFFIEDHPISFAPEAGAWGRQGCTRVILKNAAEDAVGEALTLAWQNIRKKAGKKSK